MMDDLYIEEVILFETLSYFSKIMKQMEVFLILSKISQQGEVHIDGFTSLKKHNVAGVEFCKQPLPQN